jgi:hypothetical protein
MIQFLQMIEGTSVAKTKKASGKKRVTARRKVTTDRKSTKAKSKPTAKTTGGKGAAKKKSPSRAKTASRPKSSVKAKSANAEQRQPKDTVMIDRRTGGNRRKSPDQRAKNVPVAVERRKLQRRAKVNRRRQIDPTTCERDYTTDEIEFMNRLEEYKRSSGRMFPTCSEILEVIRGLGYERRPSVTVETASDANPDATSNADSLAASDANSNVASDTSPNPAPDTTAQVTQPTTAMGSPLVDMTPVGQ